MSDAPITTADALPWRFSIRSLLVVVTVVCVLLAPYHWLGWRYLFAVVWSVWLIAGSVTSYSKNGMRSPVGASLVFIVLGFLCALDSPAPLLISLANLAGCLICAPFKPATRNFAIVLSACGLVPYAHLLHVGRGKQLRIDRLRIEYPLESLRERLSFEESDNYSPRIAKPLAPRLEAALIGFEARDKRSDYWHIFYLQRLHDDAFRRRALGVGFGAKEIREASLEGPYRYSAELPIDITGWDHGLQLAKNLERIHRNTLVDFFDSDLFGAVTDDSTAIGFAAHGPTRLKYSLQIGAPVQGAPPCQLTRLELVSLLRHDEPRVYVAETIPLMNELEDIPHRPLNEFEAAALPQLETQRDTFIEETLGGAVMLGAVRAGNDCLQCHNGPRGKLLGAFSYEFRELKYRARYVSPLGPAIKSDRGDGIDTRR